MKHLRLIVSLVVTAFVLAFTPGCPSVSTPTTPNVQAYQTMKALATVVDQVMQSAAIAYHNGQITTEQWTKLAYLHDQQFSVAFETAIVATGGNYSATPTAYVQSLADQIFQLVATFAIKPTV